MRDYLFRAKKLDDSQWIEGYLIRGTDYLTEVGMTAIVTLDSMFFPANEITGYEMVDYRTVGQSTGKHDKYGKKIFEGDIVRALMDYGPAGMLESVVCIHWDDDCGWQWNYFDMDTVEVIGNIHDNPGPWLELIGNRYGEKGE